MEEIGGGVGWGDWLDGARSLEQRWYGEDKVQDPTTTTQAVE